MFIVLRALTCEYFKFGRSRGSRAVSFAISRSLNLFSRSFLRLAVVLGSEGRARATPALAPPRRWLQRARKVVTSYLRDLRTSTQSHIKIEHSQTPSQSEACLCFCDNCCCCCFPHINRSGLNHTRYYTWLQIRYVVCWTEKDQRNIYQAPMRAKEKLKQTKTTKRKEQE